METRKVRDLGEAGYNFTRISKQSVVIGVVIIGYAVTILLDNKISTVVGKGRSDA